MPGPFPIHRLHNICITCQHGFHGFRQKKRNISRTEKNTVAFILQIFQSDFRRFKHLRILIIPVFQKRHPKTAQLLFHLPKPMPGHQNNFLYSRLFKIHNHTLRHRPVPNLHQLPKLHHPWRHLRCGNHRTRMHAEDTSFLLLNTAV